MFWSDLQPWFHANKRDLPWRINRPQEKADPYKVWLSEIMLQQTTVATVINRYQEYLAAFPTVQDLAAAPLEEILTRWQGLGYYARARNLHKCSKVVVEDFDSQFPADFETLKTLPGIGDYTAAAIMAIAYNTVSPVLDANLERVLSRVFAVEAPLPGSRPLLREKVMLTMPADAPGDYAEALMDLGSSICKPKQPLCDACPINWHCKAKAQNIAETLPKKQPKQVRPTRQGTVYWLETVINDEPQVWLQTRPASGLLGGMVEAPWHLSGHESTLPAPPIGALPGIAWQPLAGIAKHTFTHFHLELTVVQGVLLPNQQDLVTGLEGFWWPVKTLTQQPWPTLMKKVERHVLESQPSLFGNI